METGRPSQVPRQDIRGCLFFFPLKVLKFEKFRHEQDLDVPAWTGQHCLPSLYPVCPQPSSEQQSSPTARPQERVTEPVLRGRGGGGLRSLSSCPPGGARCTLSRVPSGPSLLRVAGFSVDCFRTEWFPAPLWTFRNPFFSLKISVMSG